MDTSTLMEQLTELERELHGASARRNPARLAELLHPDFMEIGRSGRVCNFEEIVALLLQEQERKPVHSQGFAVRLLAEDLAQVTYKAARAGHGGMLEQHSMRSSLWKRSANGWQIIFHQGTPIEAFNQAR